MKILRKLFEKIMQTLKYIWFLFTFMLNSFISYHFEHCKISFDLGQGINFSTFYTFLTKGLINPVIVGKSRFDTV